ncbi:hypothetical protein AeMF1_003981 [Aphanomyces euteiches]|nr:hypothetical protein AeMF1_003981 [Aphanomyces euteiches]
MGCADGLSRLPLEPTLADIESSPTYRYDVSASEWVRQLTIAAIQTRSKSKSVSDTRARLVSEQPESDPNRPTPIHPTVPRERIFPIRPQQTNPRTDFSLPGRGDSGSDENEETRSISSARLPKCSRIKYRLPPKLLRVEQAKDLFVQAVKGYLQDNVMPMDSDTLQILTRTGKHFTIDKGLLYRRTILKSPLRNPSVIKVPVIPLTMIKTILEICHDSSLSGHFGVVRTTERVKRIGYWRGWRDDVAEYCKKCLRRGAAKGTRPWKQGLTQRMPVYKLRGPFSFLVVDALGPFPLTPSGNKFVLIFVDYFTRWPEAFAVPDLKTSTFI